MNRQDITETDRKRAEACLACPLCNRARKKQRGIVFWLVKRIEGSLCPNCKAYEKVYGRKAHEAIPEAAGEAASEAQ